MTSRFLDQRRSVGPLWITHPKSYRGLRSHPNLWRPKGSQGQAYTNIFTVLGCCCLRKAGMPGCGATNDCWSSPRGFFAKTAFLYLDRLMSHSLSCYINICKEHLDPLKYHPGSWKKCWKKAHLPCFFVLLNPYTLKFIDHKRSEWLRYKWVPIKENSTTPVEITNLILCLSWGDTTAETHVEIGENILFVP